MPLNLESCPNPEKMVDAGLAEKVLSLFENKKIPVNAMECCIESLVSLSSNQTSKRCFKELNFKLENFTKLLDEVDNEQSLSQGARVIENLSSDMDMDNALEGIKSENEDSIGFFCHLVGVNRLIPELIKKEPIQLLINTIEKLLLKSPFKPKPVSCTA
jgi:hypothetical protein